MPVYTTGIMKYSRRELSLLLPALAAAQSSGRPTPLPSQALRYQDLTPTKNGALASRQMLKGDTHTGFQIDLHESELAAGQAPHEPHRHVHEEMLLMREGEVELTLNGKTTRLGPGSVAFFASNDLHGWRNPGTAAAHYFVLALGTDDK